MRNYILILLLWSLSFSTGVKDNFHVEYYGYGGKLIVDSTSETTSPTIFIVKDSTGDTLKSYPFRDPDSSTYSDTALWADSSGHSVYSDTAGYARTFPDHSHDQDSIHYLQDSLDNKLCLHCLADSADTAYRSGWAKWTDSSLFADSAHVISPQDSTYIYPSNPQCASYGYLIKTDLHVDTALYFMLKMDYVYSSQHLIMEVFLDPQGPTSGIFPTAHAIATGYYGTGHGSADQIDSVFAYDSLGVVWIWIDINNKGGTATFTTKSGRKRVVIDSVYDAVLGDGENGGPERIELRQGGVVKQAQQYHTFYASADSSGLIESNSYEYISGTQTINGADGSNNYSWSDTNSMGIVVGMQGSPVEKISMDTELVYFGIDSMFLKGSCRIFGNLYIDGTSEFKDDVSLTDNNISDITSLIYNNASSYLFKLEEVSNTGLFYNTTSHSLQWIYGGSVKSAFAMSTGTFQIDGQANIDGGADIEGDVDINGVLDNHGKIHAYDSLVVDGSSWFTGNINIVNGIQFDNEALLSKHDTVSFAESLFDGVTFRAEVTAKYTIIGNVVTVKIPSVTGTITAATATYLRTSPSEIWPVNSTIKTVAITNNGSTEIGLIFINTNGINQLFLNNGNQFDAGTGGTITGSSITFQYMLN